MASANITYVDPIVLERLEEQLALAQSTTCASAILLIEASGVVLACVGEPPLHPDQMGAVAAGISSAMGAMIRSSRIEDFIVRVPDISACLQFHHVDTRMFLCAFYSDSQSEPVMRTALKQLALHARNALSDDQTLDRPIDHISFIEEKLNELFQQ